MIFNYISIPKFQRKHRWGLGMDKHFHPTPYKGYHYLVMPWWKLTHVSKIGPWYFILHNIINTMAVDDPGTREVVGIMIDWINVLCWDYSNCNTARVAGIVRKSQSEINAGLVYYTAKIIISTIHIFHFVLVAMVTLICFAVFHLCESDCVDDTIGTRNFESKKRLVTSALAKRDFNMYHRDMSLKQNDNLIVF